MLANKIPPPLVAIAVAGLMWAIASFAPLVLIATQLKLSLLVLILACGIGFCGAGIISFRRANTTVNPLQPETASALVSSGIYQLSRNPMYLGFAFMLVAWGFWLASLWALSGVLVFVLYMNKYQIGPEERALSQLFGDEFSLYQARVRRWL